MGADPERRWIRLAINAYTLPEELDRVAEALRRLGAEEASRA